MPQLSHLKRSIVEVKYKTNCLAHASIKSIAKETHDPNYNKYRNGKKLISLKVNELLKNSKIDFSNGGGLAEIQKFQDYFALEYNIVVFGGLQCNSVIYNGAQKTLYLLFDEVECHFNIIVNLNGTFSQRYICFGCLKGFKRGQTHTCENSCFSCKTSPP